MQEVSELKGPCQRTGVISWRYICQNSIVPRRNTITTRKSYTGYDKYNNIIIPINICCSAQIKSNSAKFSLTNNVTTKLPCSFPILLGWFESFALEVLRAVSKNENFEQITFWFLNPLLNTLNS